jgi:hypothetical protein
LNLTVPSTQEELENIAEVLDQTLTAVVNATLNEGQTLVSLTIISIAGQTLNPTATRRRLQGSVDVKYTTVIKQDCISCDEATVLASLYNQTTSEMASEISNGDFKTVLIANAVAGNATSLISSSNSVSSTSNGYTVVTKSPSASPSTRPITVTNAPTRKPSSQALNPQNVQRLYYPAWGERETCLNDGNQQGKKATGRH